MERRVGVLHLVEDLPLEPLLEQVLVGVTQAQAHISLLGFNGRHGGVTRTSREVQEGIEAKAVEQL